MIDISLDTGFAEKQNCCGCTACAAVCPKNCIEMQEDAEGFLYPYADKKRKYAAYLEKPIVKVALRTKNTAGIGRQREIALFFIKHRMFIMLDLMGKVRKWQKENR